MYAKPTIHEFLENPMGKGSNAIAARNIVRSNLQTRYEALYRKKTKLFTEKVYKDKAGEYYIHVTIPSETERTNTYDVVIRLVKPEAGKELSENSRTLNDYVVEFFSNSPSFTYTYAYAFNEYGFLVKILDEKYRDEVLTSMPSTRNPSEIISYEKSITFTLMHILEMRLNVREVLDSKAQKFDKEAFVKSIRNEDTIKLEIGKANKALRRDKSETEDRKAGIRNRMRTNVSQATKSSSRSSSSKSSVKSKTTARPKRTAKGPRPKR